MTIENPIRWGILGLGKIARKMAETLQTMPDCTIEAVASRSLEKAQAFANTYGAQRAYNSYEALANDPAIDVVYVATPHNLHAANTLMFLASKKAVLCEKPFAVNLKEAQPVFEAARQQQCFVMEALWTRFIPSFTKTVELVRNGAIGQVRSIQADFGFRANYNPSSRLFNPALAGGSLLDVGIYPVFLAATLLGMPEHISAHATMTPTGVDGQCVMALKYQNGALASLTSSLVSNNTLEAHIFGETGRITINNRWHEQTSVTLYRNWQVAETFEFEYTGNGFDHEVREVVRCLRQGRLESPVYSWADTRQLLDLLDKIRLEAGIKYPQDA